MIAILSATWHLLRSSNNSQGFQTLRNNIFNSQGHQRLIEHNEVQVCTTSLPHGTPHALPEPHKWSSLPLAQISEAGYFVVRFTQGLAKVWRSKRPTSPSIFQDENFITTHRTIFSLSQVHMYPSQTSKTGFSRHDHMTLHSISQAEVYWDSRCHNDSMLCRRLDASPLLPRISRVMRFQSRSQLEGDIIRQHSAALGLGL